MLERVHVEIAHDDRAGVLLRTLVLVDALDNPFSRLLLTAFGAMKFASKVGNNQKDLDARW